MCVIALCCREKYYAKDFPPIDSTQCEEIKAKDGKITFQNGKYYKYTDEDAYRIGGFWRYLRGEVTFIGLTYTREEQKKFLNSVGIGLKRGFFTVQTGNITKELYYSNGTAGLINAKERYDHS